MIINTAYDSKSFCSIYNIAIDKICPNDVFKIIFDNDFFLIASASFYKKENSNTSAYKSSLM